jgi:hypothetical protein
MKELSDTIHGILKVLRKKVETSRIGRHTGNQRYLRLFFSYMG